MKITYSNKYVAFIDVLGFTDLVYSNSKEKLEKYFEIVDMAFEIFGSHKKHLEKLAISDSIILAVEGTPENLKLLIQSIKTLQYFLARRDIWVRGGISYGEVYFNSNSKIIVGKGFINAYLLEKEAKYPRVIIDPQILTKLDLTRRQFYDQFNGQPNEYLTEGKLIHDYGLHNTPRNTEDDTFFVCYASKTILKSSIDQPLLINEGEKDLDMVYNHIRKNLYNSQKHYSKYLWLKKYFHEAIYEYMQLMKNTDNVNYKYLDKMAIEFANL